MLVEILEMKKPDPLHDVKSAGKFLGGVSEHTVRTWLRDRRLTRVKVGRRTMVRESDLMRFVATCNK